MLRKFTEGVFPDEVLATMCKSAYDFGVPLEVIQRGVYLMRLDQGPTASFKDFAAQMMAQMFGRFLQEVGGQVTIPTATSGETAAAVAHAFHEVPGVRVIVLFPIAEVSESQRKLMTTLRDNIRTVAVDGKFDDCQAMVKCAFTDPALAHIHFSSANSINIGRLLPQSVYYFYAASRLAQPGEPMVLSIPSGHYEKISPSRNSVSNAMNVGHPSNLARRVAVYAGQMDETGKIRKQPDLARDAPRHLLELHHRRAHTHVAP